MAAEPEVFTKFTVASGCLCFGVLHNIWHGASVPMQEGLPVPQRQDGGTVRSYTIEYNIPAEKGIWKAFQLIDAEEKIVTGWFVCHSDVDPRKEVDKILRISGSPYEPDCGSTVNNDKTRHEGLFVINRYDWDYYDQRSEDAIDEDADGESPVSGPPGVGAGLVDYDHAKAQVTAWKVQTSNKRELSDSGIWMFNEHGEYLFGRFGFNDEHAAARSFLLFTARTFFERARFMGPHEDQTLRKPETDEERFQRKLREGEEFSGLETIRNLCTPCGDPRVRPPRQLIPPESEMVGPFDKSDDHILRSQDIESLWQARIQALLQLGERGVSPTFRKLFTPESLPFPDVLKETCCDLLNEVILTWLDQAALPRISSHSTLLGNAEKLFPQHAAKKRVNTLDSLLYSRFTKGSSQESSPNFDSNYVEERIRKFLQTRSREDDPMPFDGEFISGMCRVVAFVMSEILELSTNASVDSWRSKIVPSSIRISVHNDEELMSAMQYSSVYWKGRNQCV